MRLMDDTRFDKKKVNINDINDFSVLKRNVWNLALLCLLTESESKGSERQALQYYKWVSKWVDVWLLFDSFKGQ